MPTAQKSFIGRIPLVWRILIGFVLGVTGGLLMQRFASPETVSRVLSVTALGKDLREAVDKAYAGVRAISFEGAHYRTDIARRAFGRD